MTSMYMMHELPENFLAVFFPREPEEGDRSVEGVRRAEHLTLHVSTCAGPDPVNRLLVGTHGVPTAHY